MSDIRSPRSSLGASQPLVPPIYQSSVYVLPDLDALDRIMNAEESGFIYARDSHPNARSLAEKLVAFEGAEWGLVTSSGMAALSVILLATTQPNSRIVASNRLYGRTSQLLHQELHRYGIVTEFVDVNDLEAVDRALDKPARMILVETVSNPLLRISDVSALARLAHEREALLVVDNTFATPVLTKPLEMGADLVMESVTKMIGGHSDVTLGFVGGRGELFAEMAQVSSIWGFSANPFDCWLAERGLETLEIRTLQASANAHALAKWLSGRRGVSRVLYPGLRDHPDHRLASRVLKDSYGNMLCFELEGGREAVNRFLHQATNVPFSPSLGNTTTTCSHPATTSHRYVSPAEKQRQGITDGLLRLSVGIERVEHLQAELARGIS